MFRLLAGRTIHGNLEDAHLLIAVATERAPPSRCTPPRRRPACAPWSTAPSPSSSRGVIPTRGRCAPISPPCAPAASRLMRRPRRGSRAGRRGRRDQGQAALQVEPRAVRPEARSVISCLLAAPLSGQGRCRLEGVTRATGLVGTPQAPFSTGKQHVLELVIVPDPGHGDHFDRLSQRQRHEPGLQDHRAHLGRLRPAIKQGLDCRISVAQPAPARGGHTAGHLLLERPRDVDDLLRANVHAASSSVAAGQSSSDVRTRLDRRTAGAWSGGAAGRRADLRRRPSRARSPASRCHRSARRGWRRSRPSTGSSASCRAGPRRCRAGRRCTRR